MMLVPGLVLLAVCFTNAELVQPVLSVSAVLCVAALGGLAAMGTANTGCEFDMVGVFGALVATL